MQPVDRSAEPELIYTGEYHLHLTDWSPDGKWLAFYQFNPNTQADIWLVSTDGEGQLIPVLTTQAQERDAAFHPDGQWLAYSSNQSGITEVYAMSYPELGPPVRITQNGGTAPHWNGRGNELFYQGAGGDISVVPVSTQGGVLRPGVPKALFPTQ